MKHRLALTVTAVAAALAVTGCAAGITPANGWAPPVDAPDGYLLVQSGVGRVAAVTPTGTRAGEFELRGPMGRDFLGRSRQEDPAPLYAAPIVDGDAIYLASYRGRIARLRFEGGVFSPVWESDLHERVVATPTLRGDQLYVSAENGRVHVLNAANGTVISTSRPTTGRVWGAPELQGDRLYIGTLDSSELLAFDIATQSTEWTQGVSGATASDLVLDDDLLVVASFDRTIHALETAGGEERWRFYGDGWFVSAPAVTPRGIFAGTMRGSVYSIDHAGTERWRYTREGLEFRPSPLLIGDTVVVASRNGTIVGLDASNGAERWTRTVEDVSIDANGVVLESDAFFVTVDRQLIRVNPANGDIQVFNIQPPGGGN